MYRCCAIETLAPSPLDWTMETGCGKTTIFWSNLSATRYVFSVDDSSEDDSSVK